MYPMDNDTPEQLIAELNQLFTPAPPPYTATDSSQATDYTIVLTQPAPSQIQECYVTFKLPLCITKGHN